MLAAFVKTKRKRPFAKSRSRDFYRSAVTRPQKGKVKTLSSLLFTECDV